MSPAAAEEYPSPKDGSLELRLEVSVYIFVAFCPLAAGALPLAVERPASRSEAGYFTVSLYVTSSVKLIGSPKVPPKRTVCWPVRKGGSMR